MNTPAASPPERSEQDLITALQATVSASRLSLFLQCRLKFYFRYVLKLKKPKTASLHLGNAVHAVLKAWNKARWVQQPLSLKVVHETKLSAMIDGGNNVGYYAVMKATELAIEKARSTEAAAVAHALEGLKFDGRALGVPPGDRRSGHHADGEEGLRPEPAPQVGEQEGAGEREDQAGGGGHQWRNRLHYSR